MPTAVALVPARVGSQRVPGKNVRVLGRPSAARLLDRRRAARAASSTRSSSRPTRAEIAERRARATAPRSRACGRPRSRPRPSPDIDWVRARLMKGRRRASCFAILRPTSPFRRGGDDPARARAACSRSAIVPTRSAPSSSAASIPAKMWVLDGRADASRCCRSPRARRRCTRASTRRCRRSTSRTRASRSRGRACSAEDRLDRRTAVAPFLTEGAEGFSIDYPDDFERAETPRRSAARRSSRLSCSRAAMTPPLRPASASSSGCATLDADAGRARGGIRRRLPDQHAVDDRVRRLRSHRHELQLPRHPLLAPPRGARARATATSPPRVTTRRRSTRC